MFTGRLTGEVDGYAISKDFTREGDAIAWLKGAGLAEFRDQTARGEVIKGGMVVWFQSALQTADQREREYRREAGRYSVAGLGARRGRFGQILRR